MKASKRELEKIDQLIADMRASYEGKLLPNWKPETSNQIRDRAKRQRDMSNGIRLVGGKVRPEYEPLNEDYEYGEQ